MTTNVLASLLPTLPKEEKFNHMLTDLAHQAKESARLLNVLVKSANDPEIVTTGQQLCEVQRASKKVYETLTREVCQTFITPFDREDLKSFAHTLYLIPKLVEKIQDRIIIHTLKTQNDDFTRLADIVERQANILEKLVKQLNHGRRLDQVRELYMELDDLEDRADKLASQLLADVFWNVQDTREVILRKDVYEMMEQVTDFFRDCGNVGLQIVLKHS